MTRLTNLLCTAVALLVMTSAAAALSGNHDGPRITATTVRGELATYQGSGLYRFDPRALAREGLVWDTINLFLGAPALLFATFRANRGSTRGRLSVAGLSLYFAYTYLQYATMMAVTVLFPLYVAIFGASLTCLFLVVSTVDAEQLKARLAPKLPRRFFAGYGFATAVALLAIWGKLLFQVLTTGKMPDGLAGMVTFPTQALDLGVVAPLGIATGILLLKNHPLGYLLCALNSTFGLMMSITIPAWIAVPMVQDGQLKVFEAAPFMLLCAFGLTLAIIFMRSVDDGPSAPTGRLAHPITA